MLPLKWTFIQRDWYPYKKRKLGHRHAQREEQVKTQEKTCVYRLREEALGRTNPSNMFISDLKPLELREREGEEKEMCVKELTHAVMEAYKSQICKMGQKDGDPVKRLVKSE